MVEIHDTRKYTGNFVAHSTTAIYELFVLVHSSQVGVYLW